MTPSQSVLPFGRTALVTVLYNSAEVLPDFLQSLSLQTDSSWALVVVDNASTDDGVEQVNRWTGPLHGIIRNQENAGFAKATNQGIVAAMDAGFDAVVLLNNDTVFGESFLAELLQAPERRTYPILSPVILYEAEPNRLWFAQGRYTRWRGAFQSEMLEHMPTNAPAVWLTDFIPGCAKLISRSVIEQIGLLDEQFFVYWEDADYSWRCREANIPLAVLRDIKIFHKVSALTQGTTSPFSIRMYQANQIKFLRKHFGEMTTWLQVPAIVAKCALRLAIRRDGPTQSRQRLRAIWGELTGRWTT